MLDPPGSGSTAMSGMSNHNTYSECLYHGDTSTCQLFLPVLLHTRSTPRLYMQTEEVQVICTDSCTVRMVRPALIVTIIYLGNGFKRQCSKYKRIISMVSALLSLQDNIRTWFHEAQ